MFGLYPGDLAIASALSPASFGELRAWYAIEQAPANGAAVNSTWPVRAGTQSIDLVARNTVVRDGTAPSGIVGMKSEFTSSGFTWADMSSSPIDPWVSADGSLTMFFVGRAYLGSAGGMMPLGNPAGGGTNFMKYAATLGGYCPRKNYFLSSETVSAATWAARVGEFFCSVSTYSNAGIETYLRFQDGTIFTKSHTEATSITNACGLALHLSGDNAFPDIWGQGTNPVGSTDTGVIGRALTSLERADLCLSLLRLRGCAL